MKERYIEKIAGCNNIRLIRFLDALFFADFEKKKGDDFDKLFERFLNKRNEIISSLSKATTAIEKRDYTAILSQLKIFAHKISCLLIGYNGNLFFTDPQELIEPLKNHQETLIRKLQKILDSDPGSINLFPGIAEKFEDLEKCLKKKNYYDCYFLCEEISEEINGLSLLNFDLKLIKRRLALQLRDLRNLILCDTDALTLWQKINFFDELKDAIRELVDAQENHNDLEEERNNILAAELGLSLIQSLDMDSIIDNLNQLRVTIH